MKHVEGFFLTFWLTLLAVSGGLCAALLLLGDWSGAVACAIATMAAAAGALGSIELLLERRQ